MPLSALDIYKKLPQTNCGKFQLPSCLAFAAAIVAGRKKLKDYKDLAPESKAKLSVKLYKPDLMEIEQALFVDKLQKKMESINLEAVAPLIGATVKNGRP